MMFKNLTVAFLSLLAVSFLHAETNAEYEGLKYSTSGDIVLGEWTSQFTKAKQYAEENGIPLVVYWGNAGCSHCETTERQMATEQFASWQKERGLVMVFTVNGVTDPNETALAKSFTREDGSSYPYLGVYWPDRNLSGLLVSKKCYMMPDKTASQVMNLINILLNGYVPRWPKTSPKPLSPSFGQVGSFTLTSPRGTNWYSVATTANFKYAFKWKVDKNYYSPSAVQRVVFEDGDSWESTNEGNDLVFQTVARGNRILFGLVVEGVERLDGCRLQHVAMTANTPTSFPEVSIKYQEPGQSDWKRCFTVSYNIVPNGALVMGEATAGDIVASIGSGALNYPSDLLTSNLSIASKTTVRMQAVASGYVRSEEVSASFALGVCDTPSVTYTTVSGDYGPQRVTLSTPTAGTAIRYTLDGTEVTETSTLYTTSFVVPESTTIKAKAFKPDWVESETRIAWIDDQRIDIGDTEIRDDGFVVEDDQLKVAIEVFDWDGIALSPTNYVVSYTNVCDGEVLENALLVRVEGLNRYKGAWECIYELPSKDYAVVEGQVWFYREESFGATIVSGPIVDGVLTIPAKVNGLTVCAIADEAFYSNPWLWDVRLPDSVFHIGSCAFEDTPFWYSLWETAPEGSLVTIGKVVVGVQGELKSTVVVPEGIRGIGACAFDGHCEIRSITLPEGLLEIGAYAFANCGSLWSITPPKSVLYIGTEALGWDDVPVLVEAGDETRVRLLLQLAGYDANCLFVGTRESVDLLLSEDAGLSLTNAEGVITSQWFPSAGGRKGELIHLTCAGRGTLKFRWAIRTDAEQALPTGSTNGCDLVFVEDWRTDNWRLRQSAGYVGAGANDTAWNEKTTELEIFDDGLHDLVFNLADEITLLQGNVKIEICDISWTPAGDDFGVKVTLDPNGGTLRGGNVLTCGRWYGELPSPVRIGAEFIGWTTLSKEEIVDPWETPLMCDDETPLASNVALTAVWAPFDPCSCEGEWEQTERGMRCRVERYSRNSYIDTVHTASFSYEVPGRGWVRFKFRVLDACDESRVLYASGGSYSCDGMMRSSLSTDDDDAWYASMGLTPDWTTQRVAVRTGDPTEFMWAFANYRKFPVIVEIADITWEWAPNDFAVNVTLDPCGGSVIPSEPLVRHSRYGMLPEPVREGSSFCGWSEGTYYSSCVETVCEDTWTPLSSNVTLYAVWDTPVEEVLDPKYTLRDEEAGNWFEFCNFCFGVENTWQTVYETNVEGEVIWESPREVFGGEVLWWNGEVECGEDTMLLELHVHGCGTLHFKRLSCWGEARVLVDGEEQDVSQVALENELPFDVEIRRKDGLYAHECGDLLADDPEYDEHVVQIVVRADYCCSYSSRTDLGGSLGPIVWERAPNEVAVCFDACGGTVSGDTCRTYSVGETYGTFPVPTRNKCTFLGWFTESAGSEQVSADELVRLAVTNLYARWSIDLKTAMSDSTLRFATKGSHAWTGSTDYAHEPGGASAAAGNIAWGQTNVMTSVVQGPGLLSFWWMTGEDMSWFCDASLSVWVDGQELRSCDMFSVWRHMTLPILGSGNHIVEWKYTPGSSIPFYLERYFEYADYSSPIACWQANRVLTQAFVGYGLDLGCRPGAWVDEVRWTAAGSVKDIGLWAKGVWEGHAWLTDTLPLIEATYGAKIDADPANCTWRIFRALTKVVGLGENESFLAILKRFGYSPDYQVLGRFFGSLDYADAPLSNALVETVADEAVPVLESALADLEAIPADWADSVALDPADFPVDDRTFVDIADVTLSKSVLKGMLAALAIAESYDLSVDYMNIEMEVILAEAGLPMTLEYAVMDHPEFMKRVRNAERLAEGRELLREALQTYQVFDELMQARNTSEMHFFEYAEEDAEAQESVRTKVAQMLAALDGPVDLTPGDFRIFRHANMTNVAQAVSLVPFFEGDVTRRYLPTQIEDNRPVFDTFPTMAFGGIFPGLGKATVAGWLADNGIDVSYTPESDYEPAVEFRTFSAAIPNLGATATRDEIDDALSGTADPQVLANVNDAKSYAEYEKWASGLGRSGVSLKAVKASPYAWVSSALSTPTLMTKPIESEDLKVESFEPDAESGTFAFTVSVKDVEVGSDASKENLKRIFGLEGATSLDAASFSSDNVDLEFDTPENGNVKFRATPKGSPSSSFFMRVKTNQ